MKITKHRDEIILTMSSEELIFLVNHLGSHPETVEAQEKVVQMLHDLTFLQRYAEAYDKYLCTLED